MYSIFSSQRLPLKVLSFLLVVMALSFSHSALAATPKEDPLYKFVSSYYQSFPSDQAPQVLKNFFASEDFKKYAQANPHVLDMLAFFFGRAAEEHSKLFRSYEKMYEKADPVAQVFLNKVFSYSRDKRVEKFLKSYADKNSSYATVLTELLSKPPQGNSAYLKSVDNLWQLDFLWMEFYATGDETVIYKIMDVLSWKDGFKTKLQNWMLSAHEQLEKDTLSDLLRKGMRADVDVANVQVNYVGDMDCLFSSFLRAASAGNQNAQLAQKIKAIIGLNEMDYARAAVKGTALAGLWENATVHPKILAICRKELKTRKDKSTVELQNIVNSVERAHAEAKNKKRSGEFKK